MVGSTLDLDEVGVLASLSHRILANRQGHGDSRYPHARQTAKFSWRADHPRAVGIRRAAASRSSSLIRMFRGPNL